MLTKYYAKTIYKVKELYTNEPVIDLSYTAFENYADGEPIEKYFSFYIFKLERGLVFQLYVDQNGTHWKESHILTEEMISNNDEYILLSKLGLDAADVEKIKLEIFRCLFSNSTPYSTRLFNKFLKDSKEISNQRQELERKELEFRKAQEEYEDNVIRLLSMQDAILKN